MIRVTVSAKYQIVIPKEIRRQAHIQKGRKLVALYKDGVINLVPQRPIADMKGILKGMNIRSLREKKDRL